MIPRRQAIHPGGARVGASTPLFVLGLAWTGLALVWLAWLAGRFVSLATGHGWHQGPGFGGAFITGLIRGRWRALWPHASAELVAGLYTVLVVIAATCLAVGWWLWQRRRPTADDPLPSLATPTDIAVMTLPGVVDRARRLRPSLQSARRVRSAAVAPAEIGIALGFHRRRRHGSGPMLYASWEDVVLAVMAPRAGKTTALAVPAVLDAPGAVIATSNKPDLWATTHTRRAQRGVVRVFDPQRIVHEPQTWWWNPLAAIGSVEDAFRFADHFVQQIRHASRTGEDFWVLAAQDLLTSLTLAAAISGGTLIDVQAWLSDPTVREPAAILREHRFDAAARALMGRQAGAPETRDGVYETARTAAACLANPKIMAWVTPPSVPMDRLETEGLATTDDTLYLLSKDGAGNAAPLVAALTDQVLRHGIRTAEVRGGRLDPPLVAVLDEAANICKISDLPDLYSHLGSRGITPITILQSYRQGQRVWGEHGMGALWSAATCKLIGAGIDDPRLAEDLSRLVGDHDVPVGSCSRDGRGYTTWQTSLRRQRILEPAQIRALSKGTALLLATGVRPALLDLKPWYAGPERLQLEQDVEASTALITSRASAAANLSPP